MIYLLRVGWRLQYFFCRISGRRRASHAPVYDRLTLQGPPFFNRSRTGDLMARATNDGSPPEAFLAGFDGGH